VLLYAVPWNKPNPHSGELARVLSTQPDLCAGATSPTGPPRGARSTADRTRPGLRYGRSRLGPSAAYCLHESVQHPVNKHMALEFVLELKRVFSVHMFQAMQALATFLLHVRLQVCLMCIQQNVCHCAFIEVLVLRKQGSAHERFPKTVSSFSIVLRPGPFCCVTPPASATSVYIEASGTGGFVPRPNPDSAWFSRIWAPSGSLFWIFSYNSPVRVLFPDPLTSTATLVLRADHFPASIVSVFFNGSGINLESKRVPASGFHQPTTSPQLRFRSLLPTSRWTQPSTRRASRFFYADSVAGFFRCFKMQPATTLRPDSPMFVYITRVYSILTVRDFWVGESSPF